MQGGFRDAGLDGDRPDGVALGLKEARIFDLVGRMSDGAADVPVVVSDAGSLSLPHQVQRVIGLASEPGVLTGRTVRQQAWTALTRLERQFTGTAGLAGSGAAVRLPGITAGEA